MLIFTIFTAIFGWSVCMFAGWMVRHFYWLHICKNGGYKLSRKTWAEDSTNREKTTHTTANDNDGMKQRQTGKEKKNMIYYSGSMEIANV